MLRAATGLVTCVVLSGAPAGPSPDRDPSRLRPGLFLYAAPDLLEPRFAETVVLLIEHGPDGSMGLVVNRPTDIRVRQALEEVEEARGSDLPLYWGGPVQPEAVLALVRSPRPSPGARTVLADVHLTGDLADVRAALAGRDPHGGLRVYSGYAGWAAGQLQAEVRRGDWVLDRADAALVFAPDPSNVWPRVHLILNRLEVRDRSAPLLFYPFRNELSRRATRSGPHRRLKAHRVRVPEAVVDSPPPSTEAAMIREATVLASLCPLFAAAALTRAAEPKAPSTRELERINWMEFREWVPGKVQTVLLPLGTLEAHGVTANGADILAPVAIAREIAPQLEAFVAPVIPYGFTGSMDAYPGAFTVPQEPYRAYVRAVLVGLARNRFRNIVMINGHGGGQTAILSALAQDVGREERVRILVVNWWSHCADVTREVFGEDGGHAGDNETAFMQAIDPALVHPERYRPEMALPNPAPGAWSAYPSPTTIGLYTARQGYPRFDAGKAKIYFRKVNDKVLALVEDTIRRWDAAGL